MNPNEESSTDKPKSTAKNWDKIVKEFEEEEEEINESQVVGLFRKIYSQGDEETKKAMIKSFTESGGTVLSTNWQQVSKDKVGVEPPDGCELKKWEK
ncbi:uncharacterized protein LOC141858678 [Brevipalpus obovatus]|uniref:uncharacterized protein LOC141858678 n=1 Tax=Brevipalpus obovatus TaxID=246614 RepID=UPI003D9EACF8